ncbi:unnamed protein product [Brachionus calyciflorus]|uniref:Uncharacterized protein n=1 Tax=Brachionus calyciflorus TaxID=104777 RepID=A0A814HB04_9BILA|nr:unnamed protein product [Brachionus calyciflorus]
MAIFKHKLKFLKILNLYKFERKGKEEEEPKKSRGRVEEEERKINVQVSFNLYCSSNYLSEKVMKHLLAERSAQNPQASDLSNKLEFKIF